MANGYTFRGANLSKLFDLPSEKGSVREENNLLPSKFFPFRLFSDEAGAQESKQEVTKVAFPVQRSAKAQWFLSCTKAR